MSAYDVGSKWSLPPPHIVDFAGVHLFYSIAMDESILLEDSPLACPGGELDLANIPDTNDTAGRE